MLHFELAWLADVPHTEVMDSRRIWACLLLCLPWAACSLSGQTGSPANGLPGAGSAGTSTEPPDASGGGGASVGDTECYEDAECVPPLTQWTEPLDLSLTLERAVCAHTDPGLNPLPVCQCTVHVEPGTGTAFETTLLPGDRGFDQERGCSLFGRAGPCLYCASEFPGCHLGSEDDCMAICEDAVERVQKEWDRSFIVDVRLARCVSNRCESVIEIDGVCYVRQVLPDSVGYDCSLSNEELLAKGMNPNWEPACPAIPPQRCDTAADCPGGLGCNAGECGACSGSCSYSDEDPSVYVCEGDAACLSGERCEFPLCVPVEQLACRGFDGCPSGQNCVLSGVEFNVTRGNDATSTVCQ
jgi:hypothetical protein